MKKLLYLLLLMMPAIAYCGDKNTIMGSWKEVSRKTNKEKISYTDTIRLRFSVGNEVLWQKANGIMQKGTYKIENNALDMGFRYFTIVERKNNRMILKDDAATYEFVPFTEDGPGARKADEIYAPVTSIQQMVGHWSVFKATSDRTQQAIDYSRKIKWIEIFPSEKNGSWGNFYCTKDADNAPSWMVKNFGNQSLYLDGKDSRVFQVLKCAGNELILKEDGMTYFFRQFK